MRHIVPVVRLDRIDPHPQSDVLGITQIRGYIVVVRLDQWKPGDLGVYIEPDYVVPDQPWTTMLKGHFRIRVKRLRGIYSQGLLLPLADVGLPADTPEGTNVMEKLGITRYEPPADPLGAEDAPAPSFLAAVPAYDLESWRSWFHRIAADEVVVVTEKLHGESARFVWDGEAMHAGSRTRWKRLDTNSSWAIALRTEPWIEAWCREHPHHVLYGEVFGNVPTMAYGVPKGARSFRAFDVLVDGEWLPWLVFSDILPASRRVPVLFVGRHDQVTAAMAEGPSMLARHVREGFVVKTVHPRIDPELGGRVALKCVGNGYLERGD